MCIYIRTARFCNKITLFVSLVSAKPHNEIPYVRCEWNKVSSTTHNPNVIEGGGGLWCLSTK